MTDDERIEKVLSEMENNRTGMLDISKFLVEQFNDNDNSAYRRIKSVIVSMGLAKSFPTAPIVEILPAGRDVVKSGGYIKFIEKLKLDQEEAEHLKKIGLEDAELKLKLNRFYFKFRWIPFAFSIAALIISILVAIFK
ncbi:MAG: hypothetical protein WC879_16925 [Melioribacteraceae bacterium]